MEKRVNNTTTTEAPDKPAPTAIADGYRGIHWRCPHKDCGRVQLAERSETHESKCKGCGKLVLVRVKAVREKIFK